MDEILEVAILVEDEQQAYDFAAMCGISDFNVYNEFSVIEYAVDDSHQIFFYMISELLGEGDSIIRQLIPKIPLTVLLVNDGSKFTGSKIAELYESYIQNYKTPLAFFQLDDEDNNSDILKQHQEINDTGERVIYYKHETMDFFHKLAEALKLSKLALSKE